MSGDRRDRGDVRRRLLDALEPDGRTAEDREPPAARDAAVGLSADGGAASGDDVADEGVEPGTGRSAAGAVHAPVWQCADCGRSFPDRPDACPECGTATFGRFERP